MGRFEFTTHRVGAEYDTSKDFFPELKGKEFYKTTGFKEIAMTYGDTEQSYRKTAELINRIRYQMQGNVINFSRFFYSRGRIHFYVLVCEDTCAPAGAVRWT